MILPITITITTTPDDRFLAETSGGIVEAGSLRELGDHMRDLLADLEEETASEGSDTGLALPVGHRSGDFARTGPEFTDPQRLVR